MDEETEVNDRWGGAVAVRAAATVCERAAHKCILLPPPARPSFPNINHITDGAAGPVMAPYTQVAPGGAGGCGADCGCVGHPIRARLAAGLHSCGGGRPLGTGPGQVRWYTELFRYTHTLWVPGLYNTAHSTPLGEVLGAMRGLRQLLVPPRQLAPHALQHIMQCHCVCICMRMMCRSEWPVQPLGPGVLLVASRHLAHTPFQVRTFSSGSFII
jgi:hypothetical protein